MLRGVGTACYTVVVRPVIALLSDFGLRDHYVAAMKGTILRICPDASLVDITHDIPPQDVVAGALELAACHAVFPDGAIFLAVVDPGVGSRRRAVAASARGYFFVAPDNGLLGPVLKGDPSASVVELTRAEFAAASVSRTFEGRDRFAPAAAWLAAGIALDALGPPVRDWVALDLAEPVVAQDRIEGVIVRVDRFGNLVSNIPGVALAHTGENGGSAVQVSVAGGAAWPLVGTYSEVPPGAGCALVGSTGHVELSVNGGSAAQHLGVALGARVTVQFMR